MEVIIDGKTYVPKEEVKVKEEYLVIIEGYGFDLKVAENGDIQIQDTTRNITTKWIGDSLPALYKAVELSKKLRGEK